MWHALKEQAAESSLMLQRAISGQVNCNIKL